MTTTKHYCKIQETLQPLLTSMKLLGIYHDVSVNSNSVGQSPQPPRLSLASIPKYRRWIIDISGYYSLVVIFLLWFNFFRFLVGLFPRDAGFVSRIIFLIWYAQCAITATIMYFACHRCNNFPAFIKHWNTHLDALLTSKNRCERQNLKKYVITATAVCWFFFVFNNVGVLYLLNGNLTAAYAFKMDIIKPFPESTATFVVCSFIHVLETGAWLFPIVFVVTLSYTIKTKFDEFSRALEEHMSESKTGIPMDLPAFRFYHLSLCKAVVILDRVFMYLMSVCFGANIILCCFILYVLVITSLDPLSLTMYIFWLSSGVCIILVTTSAVAQVSDAAHGPLEHILRIQGGMTEDLGQFMYIHQQLQLFIAKLTGTKIGFTVLNMLVITKEVILMIGGAFITYFFILLQFRLN